MPAFTKVELRLRAASAHLVIDEVQREDGLVDEVDFSDDLRKRGGPVFDLQGAHHHRCGPGIELELADQAQHIIRVWPDTFKVHALPSQGVEFAFVRLWVDAPKARAAEMGQA